LASGKYREESENDLDIKGKARYSKSWYTNLSAELMCVDTTREYVSDSED